MSLKQLLINNFKNLKSNQYPGRGIIIGMSPDSRNLIQVYWIMGRSENSRNRIFENENGFIRTKAFDESKLIDPSLIIYYPTKHYQDCHIVSNGDQTDTIYDSLKKGESFESALNTRCYEPDTPNFTPRISGIINLKDSQYAYKLSILKSFCNTSDFCIRNYYNYEKGVPGVGHCIHTYSQGSILNEYNKISILVKYINIEDGSFEIRIINKYK